MGRVEFREVSKQFREVTALSEFTLAVDDGELIAVLGPSGCGKSTLLRVTAGLEELSGGTIHVDGRRVDNLRADQRDVAMVFQNYALYPHMTVRGNIEFPLRMRRVRRAERLRQVEEVAALLELDELLERRPAELSGGQRQRVALARALVRRPALFLLDEPLSNLDARLRLGVRQHLRSLQRRLGVTMLYVTHDQTEAMTLGDRVVVMDRGRIQQVDTPIGVYERPANIFVAGFVGTPPMNLIAARWANGRLAVAGQDIPVAAQTRTRLGAAPRDLWIGVRPEAFVSKPGVDSGVVAILDRDTIEVLGSETLVRATVGAQPVTVRLPGAARELPERVSAAPESLLVYCAESGARIGSGVEP